MGANLTERSALSMNAADSSRKAEPPAMSTDFYGPSPSTNNSKHLRILLPQMTFDPF